MPERFSKWVLGNPWWVLAATLVFVIVSSLGIGLIEFRSDARVFFSDKNPELSAFESFEEKYGRDDTLAFVVSADEGDLFTADRLEALTNLTDAVWGMPHVKRVDSVTDFQRVAAQGDEGVIDHR